MVTETGTRTRKADQRKKRRWMKETPQAVRYTFADTRLGPLLVAAEDGGICAVFLARPRSDLLEALGREFPTSRREEDRQGLDAWLGPIAASVQTAAEIPDLPADLRGTDFQLRVWRALMAIPRGETRSYKELARSLDRPEAARAVARACATNRTALLVPCHRVVRTDGTTGGYRWGAEVKRKLLKWERAPAASVGRAPSFGQAITMAAEKPAGR